MAPRVNPFKLSWDAARRRGVSKDAWSRGFGLSRNRADELTAGREKGTLGERAELNRRLHGEAYLIRYKAADGSIHGYYVKPPAGMTLGEVYESGLFYDVADEVSEGHYEEAQSIVSVQRREPRNASAVKVYRSRKIGDIPIGPRPRYDSWRNR